MNLATLFPALMPLAWLLPNHYFPWVSAWHEAIALVSVAAAVLVAQGAARLPIGWVSLIALGLASVAAQWLGGRVFFGGDALMTAVYLAALAAALSVGYNLGARPSGLQRQDGSGAGPVGIEAYGGAVLLAAIASVAIALLQWTGAASLGIWQVDMPPGGRPYGNVAQPNHLCTICALGVIASGILRQTGRIGAVGFWVAVVWMLLGMVLTGSRTGWLQVAVVAGLTMVLSQRAGVLPGRRAALALAALYAAGVLAWPALNGLMSLQEGRALSEFAQPGTRWLHWTALADAVTREPLWGYGWQQVSVAQVRGAELHPVVGEYIEHSHNLVLDLVLWAGLPIGLTIAGLAGYWLVMRLKACRDGLSAWLLMGVAVLAVHALLEYPLSYAYFLVPLGVMVGAVDRLQDHQDGFQVGLRIQRVGAAGLLAMLAWIGSEYLEAEQGHRLLRLESARIGTTGLQTPPPELRLLTQLGAFQRFAHTQAFAGMSSQRVDEMRRVAERFAYPPSMFRYALAAGLNGQPEIAALTLVRLCRIHPVQRCNEAREAWASLQSTHPALKAVSAPPAP